VGVYRDCPIFWVLQIISGTGIATNFKFGQTIRRINRNKSGFKILEKRERRHIQGLPKVFGYPLLSQEQVKLRTSNFVHIFIALADPGGSHRVLTPLKICRRPQMPAMCNIRTSQPSLMTRLYSHYPLHSV